MKREDQDRQPTVAAPAVDHMTKTTMAVRALREAILQGDILPGDQLTILQLAAQMRMSQTPVREAVRILQTEGLIEQTPHHIIIVKQFTDRDIDDIFTLRARLEALATEQSVAVMSCDDLAALEALHATFLAAHARGDLRAMYQINSEWHHLLYAISGNNILLDVIHRLWQRFLWGAFWMVPGHAARSVTEHEALMTLLRARDARGAGTAMGEHIFQAHQSAKASMRTRRRID